MLEICIIGTGRVGSQLVRVLSHTNSVKITQIYNRTKTKLKAFESIAPTTSEISDLKSADLALIAVKDDAIAPLISSIASIFPTIAHTSGSLGLQKHGQNNAVFYPLQSFSQKEIDFNQVPLCIEADNRETFDTIENLAKKISTQVYSVTTEQRKYLHLAAVFANNFTNQMYAMAQKICQANNLDFEILHPLIQETVTKIKTTPAIEAQTGPALRQDTQTMQRHLKLLSTPEEKEIYSLLSRAIQNTHKL
jgi:predicted short-subunit dehydrogenase-like oxidoreductase (DUF2520 family)